MGKTSRQASCNGMVADPLLMSVVLETATCLVHWAAGLRVTSWNVPTSLGEGAGLGYYFAWLPLAVPVGTLE